MEITSYLSANQKKHKRRRMYAMSALAFAAAYLVFGAIFWVVFRSSLFQLRNVIVQGDDLVASSDVLAVLQSSALRDHNFIKSILDIKNMLIWPSKLSEQDLAFLPQVAAISVSKSYFSHTITATVTERTPAGIWCFMPKIDDIGNPIGNEDCYWFDGQGTLFKRGFDTEGSSLFAIHDYSQHDPGLGSKILPSEFVANMISILNAIQTSRLEVNEIGLKDIGLQEIDITTYNGPAVYFSLRFSASEDISALQNIMSKPGFAKLQYVDFRVENRAYYK